MAVLEAVRGWEEIAGLKHIGTEEDEAGSDGDEEKGEDGEGLEEGMWSKQELESDLDRLLETDYVGLLLEHDQYTDASPYDYMCGSLFFIAPGSITELDDSIQSLVLYPGFSHAWICQFENSSTEILRTSRHRRGFF